MRENQTLEKLAGNVAKKEPEKKKEEGLFLPPVIVAAFVVMSFTFATLHYFDII